MNKIQQPNIWKKEHSLIIIGIACFLIHYYRHDLKKSSLAQKFINQQLPTIIGLLSLLKILTEFTFDNEEEKL